MTPFELTILGTNAAMPAYGRFTSHQVLNVNHRLFMIDCGEGAQMRLSQYKIKKNKIEAIFISHLHGDHFYGLPGLLTSYNHLDRKDKLTLIGPQGLERFVNEVFHASGFVAKFNLEIIELQHEGIASVLKNRDVEVFAFPLKHRISTYGYKFVEASAELNIDKKAIKEFGLSVEKIKKLKNGEDIVLENGTLLKNAQATLEIKKPRAFAYCSDTIYDPDIIPYIKNCDLLYHETTYLNEFSQLADTYMHSTAQQAAKIAKAAEVKTLVTGHYSGRYKSLEGFSNEAKAVFPNTIVGTDGMILPVE